MLKFSKVQYFLQNMLINFCEFFVSFARLISFSLVCTSFPLVCASFSFLCDSYLSSLCLFVTSLCPFLSCVVPLSLSLLRITLPVSASTVLAVCAAARMIRTNRYCATSATRRITSGVWILPSTRCLTMMSG